MKISCRHLTATLLDCLHDLVENSRKTIYEFVKDGSSRLSTPVHKLHRLARKVDDKVTCPYCGKDAPVLDLERLQTYCFSCSHWGLDPRGFEHSCNECGAKATFYDKGDCGPFAEDDPGPFEEESYWCDAHQKGNPI